MDKTCSMPLISFYTLFIALLFWLGLKWEEELETERGNKWLILICYQIILIKY